MTNNQGEIAEGFTHALLKAKLRKTPDPGEPLSGWRPVQHPRPGQLKRGLSPALPPSWCCRRPRGGHRILQLGDKPRCLFRIVRFVLAQSFLAGLLNCL